MSKTYRAAQIEKPGAPLKIVELPIPTPKSHEVLIKVEACGVCHGDVIGVKGGDIPFLKGNYPLVPGHEIVGFVEEIGPNVTQWKRGDRVGVGWSGGGCEHCVQCAAHHGHGCKESTITGLKVDGGYAEYAIARVSALVSVPLDISAVEAAPLLCAGNTVLGAIRKANVPAGSLVAVQGMGGLGHLAVQYLAKMGHRVVAISRGRDKEALVRSLGAHDYIDAAATDAAQALQKMGGGAKLILCTAGNPQAIEALIPGVAFGGELCFVSAPEGPLTINGGVLLMGARRVSGFVGGEMEDAIKFSMLNGVKPICEQFPIEKAQEAFDKMMNSSVKFRSVIVPKSKE